ncbi:hypothetical protein AMAG_08179 [Allomyces macrogynus ATCC 38327]|uniref:Uncharacterized protein n=1 Tax=Allomyces macrogynus (strain ATCC 38327) TaxID=578462 RepID=A0A0L0SKG4_ALLM3|nr:hypothetical protein AMAG_08179 [Allomyces macrogynus ATCC 38327]|eukprot:KNE63011.1 hypothetical protein AMAG_08179 [Allomyces macrogynus ATCC 38327]
MDQKTPGKRPAPAEAGNNTTAGGNMNRKKARKMAAKIPTQKGATSSVAPSTFILRTLNVEKYAEARRFEISAMTNVMKKATEMAKSRAFQKVPRFLRRRAASHNPKKIPVRLRDRAIQELANDPITPKKRKPRAFRLKRRTPFPRRQARNGTWLETHLWHVKRFHMRALWGRKVPFTPTQKGARAFYRASQHATTVFDHSYHCQYEFRGPKEDIATVLAKITDPLGPRVGAGRYASGKRTVEVVLYDPTKTYPAGMLGPATCLWRPAATTTDTDTMRQMWLWTHPAIENAFVSSVASAISALGLTTVHVEQLDDIGRLALRGPKSLGLLHSVLTLADANPTRAAHSIWRSLIGTTDASPLPCGSVLGLQVWDPRLAYPPRRPTYSRTEADRACAQVVLETTWSTDSAQSTLWDPAVRSAVRRAKPREHDLNTRRRANLVPGTRLTPIAKTDVAFPLLVTRAADATIGLDLCIPRGMVLPVWRSLVWAGARPGGLREWRDQHHEAGVPAFPFDFALTDAHAHWTRDEAVVAQAKWTARPAAKRVNYAALSVERPFDPDWTGLFGAGGEDRMDVDGMTGPWLLSPALTVGLAGALDARRTSQVQTTFATLFAPLNVPIPSLDAALVQVRLSFPSRGRASEHALVYAMPSAAAEREWQRIVRSGQWDEAEKMNGIPPASQVVGYATTGRYSLAHGGTAVTACVKVGAVLKGRWVLVRATSSPVVFPAEVEVMAD